MQVVIDLGVSPEHGPIGVTLTCHDELGNQIITAGCGADVFSATDAATEWAHICYRYHEIITDDYRIHRYPDLPSLGSFVVPPPKGL